jgi:enoyl-CoA hydratase/carnithine racemase
MTHSQLADISVHDGVATITLTNAPANAYSYEMMRDLDALILGERMNDAVHVIVITGAGDRFFCAGADIAMLDNVTPSFKYNFCLHANETLCRLEQTSKLVVAAINGHCVGGGLEVALACDLRVAWSNPKIKVGLPEVKLGVLPGTGGTARLSRLLGKSKALELMIEGKDVDVVEAARIGLINKVVAAADVKAFRSAVHDYAKSFCPPGKASKAVANIKRSVQSGLEMGFTEHLAFERELQQQLFTSSDAREGIKAYVGKRDPEFTGR